MGSYVRGLGAPLFNDAVHLFLTSFSKVSGSKHSPVTCPLRQLRGSLILSPGIVRCGLLSLCVRYLSLSERALGPAGGF